MLCVYLNLEVFCKHKVCKWECSCFARADQKSGATVWSETSTEMKLWESEHGTAQIFGSGQAGTWLISEIFTNEWMIQYPPSQSHLSAEHISWRESLQVCCPQDKKWGEILYGARKGQARLCYRQRAVVQDEVYWETSISNQFNNQFAKRTKKALIAAFTISAV